jgi:tRNA dimethylallyltransferase
MVGLNAANRYFIMKKISSLAPDEIPIVCLMGPTATGKTDAAAQLFDDYESEIISVDSSLVYRNMNIGTAKPDEAFLAKYPHHIVNVRDPNDTYSVANFYYDCMGHIKRITEQGKVPILAGGTMFYYNVIEKGMSDLPKADAKLREEITAQAQELGWPKLHERLAVLDPHSAERIDSMDAQRIQRALEIVIAGGIPVADHNANRKPPPANPLLKVALTFSDRKVLHNRIERRFDIMLESGFQTEVESLLQNGVDPESTSMRMIGYRQMLAYIQNNMTYDIMRDKGIVATRQLAKRQLTWLRNQSNVLWWVDEGLESKDFRPLVSAIEQFVK